MKRLSIIAIITTAAYLGFALNIGISYGVYWPQMDPLDFMPVTPFCNTNCIIFHLVFADKLLSKFQQCFMIFCKFNKTNTY